jgi:RNA polymerase sigma factor (sigma-70 family)
MRPPEEVERLVEENMALAHYFAGKHSGHGVGDHELLSTAMDGLLRSAQEWDGSVGVPFGSYASLRIKWLYNRLFNPPRSVRRGSHAEVLSLDWELEEGTDLHSLLQDARAQVDTDSDAVAKLLKSVSRLPDRDRRLVSLRFGLNGHDDHTLDQVARVFGLTRERMRQIEQEALVRLSSIYHGVAFRFDLKTRTGPNLPVQPVSGGRSKDRVRRPYAWKNLRKRG